MTDAELEEIEKRHATELLAELTPGGYSFRPDGWYRPQGQDLDLAVEDIGKLLAEVRRLREAHEALLANARLQGMLGDATDKARYQEQGERT